MASTYIQRFNLRKKRNYRGLPNVFHIIHGLCCGSSRCRGREVCGPTGPVGTLATAARTTTTRWDTSLFGPMADRSRGGPVVIRLAFTACSARSGLNTPGSHGTHCLRSKRYLRKYTQGASDDGTRRERATGVHARSELRGYTQGASDDGTRKERATEVRASCRPQEYGPVRKSRDFGPITGRRSPGSARVRTRDRAR